MASNEWLRKCSERMMRIESAQSVLHKATWATFQTGELCRTKTIISVNNDEAMLIEQVFRSYIDDCHRILDERYKDDDN